MLAYSIFCERAGHISFIRTRTHILLKQKHKQNSPKKV